jgi:small redox-active disulfide protein 2
VKQIKILGTGCPKCEKLADVVKRAAEDSGIEYSLEKVTNIDEIMKYRVMMTPALVVDGIVKVVGKVPSEEDVKKMLA